MGRRPYDGRSRREIRNQILAKQAYVRQEMIPKGWSVEAADFTNRLIQRKPYKRLGKQGIHELKNHNWFNGFDWEGLQNKTMKPPFVPNIKNVFEYLRNLTEDFTEADCSMENSLLVRRDSFQEMFKGYDCAPNDTKKTSIPKAVVENPKSSQRTVAKVETVQKSGEETKKVKREKGKNVEQSALKKRTSEAKLKKRISQRKESIEQTREANRSFYPKKSSSKKRKKAVDSEFLKSKNLSKTLKKNSLMGEERKEKLKRAAKPKEIWNKKSKEKSKMGVLGKPSSVNAWESNEKSRNVRHVIKKRSALNRSLCKNLKKGNLAYSRFENRANQSMNPKMQEDDTELAPLQKAKQGKTKNDLKGYLSLNSKNFYESVKKPREKKKSSSSFKKNSKILKLKNPRKLVMGRGYYVSPQFDRKREKNPVFMSSLNYSRFGNKRGLKYNSFSKQSKRSRDHIQESLCLGGDFGTRVDLQESLRKASFNGSFFEKMKKFGKKRLQRASENKKNISIYLSHNNNNLRKKRMRSHKAQGNYLNAGQYLWNRRRKAPLGLNLTMIRKGFNEGKSMTLLENQRSGKNSLRMGKQGFSRGDIYRQLDEFERLKQQRVELECRQLNSRGSRKGSAFRKKGDLIREIAEITQSLSCSTNLKKLTTKLQNKENKQLEKLAQTDGLKSFYQKDLSKMKKRSQKHGKRKELGSLNSNLGFSSSGVN